jgi:CRISPR-associated protein Cmr4
MYQLARPAYLHVRTPLHAGSGAELGVVDLPIQRERSTGYPKIEGSSLKGALREAFRHVPAVTDADETLLFGPDIADGDLHGSAIGLTDARVLLFPVKSVAGVFAWTTCPSVLRRWKEDLGRAGGAPDWTVPEAGSILPGSALPVGTREEAKQVVLEEYAVEAAERDTVAPVAQDLQAAVPSVGDLPERLIVLTDDAFRDFTEMTTEVITRTKIDSETGTVAEGQLFTEEYLPAETVLYYLTMASPLRVEESASLGETDDPDSGDVLEFMHDHCPETVQIGANATIGKGLVQVCH